jgi:autotransporter-associated beta strand protein
VTLNGGDLGTGNGSTLTINGGGFVFTGSYASAGGVVLAGSSGLTNTASDGRLWAQATYTGDTVVNSGQLNIAGSGGIPTNSAVSIASGATVNLTSFFAPTNINRTIGGLTGAGVLYGAGGTVTVNKTSGSDTFSGDIQGGHGLIKAGAGTLVLAANNTYTGGTTISAGALQLGTGVGGTNGSVIGNITNNSTLIFSTAASTTNANIISGSGNVTKTGVTNSALTITNANTYSGGTTISAGEINLRNGSGLGTNGVTVADGAMLRIRAFDNSTVLIISNSMTVAGTGLAGIGAIRNQTGITTNQGKVTLSAAAMLNANTGSSLTFDVASGNAIEANNFNLTLSGAGVINVNDTIALGTGGLIKDAAGTANLNASNSYTGTTTLTAGTLALGHTDALKNSTLDTGTVNTRAVTFTVVGDNTYNLGGLSGDQAINIGNNTLSVGANNAHTTNTGILSGTGGLTKVGTGTLTLGNNQTYTGTTAVSGGTLNLSGGSLASTNYSVASTATLLISTSNEVLDTAAVTLSGGTIAKGSGAISETFGDLTLTQNSGVDFGAGTGNFTFATYTPGLFDLKFLNFNLGNSLTVNTGTFTASEFDFNGFGYSWDVVPSGGFTITAVPEPSTVLAALGLAGLMLWPAVRRLRRRIE